MLKSFKARLQSDPAELALTLISWLIYLGGLWFLAGPDSSWTVIALGAVPVFITAWSWGNTAGVLSALLCVVIHLAFSAIKGRADIGLEAALIRYLLALALLAIPGMLIGHMRDLQDRSKRQLGELAANNLKLTRLSQILEAVNQLAIDVMESQDWMQEIPGLLKSICQAAGADHLALMQLSGDGTNNYAIRSQHYWRADNDLTREADLAPPSPGLLSWIAGARNGIPQAGSTSELDQDHRQNFDFSDRSGYVVFPVFADISLWGFLAFEAHQANGLWDAPDINTFRSAAQTLGSIIYKKRIEENLDLRAKELESLQKASTNISSTDQLENNLHTVLSQIMDLTPAQDAGVYLYQNQVLDFNISLGRNLQPTLPFTHPGELEISTLAASSNQDLFISDLGEFADLANQHEAVISFPLRASSEVIGVLNVWYPSPREFEEEEKKILRLLADQASSAVINVQFLQAEREQRILADSLNKANLLLSDNLDLKQVLESILEQVLSLVSARDSQIFLFDGKKLEFGAVRYADGVQPHPVPPPAKNSVYYRTARTGEVSVVPDLREHTGQSASWKSGSLVSLPLIFHRTVIGIMNISFFEPGMPDEQLLQVLNLLSNQAAIAINNARTFEAERDQRRLAQALQHTGRAIQSSLDLEVVLDQILTQIASVIPYHSANLILIEDGNAIVVRQQGYEEDQTTEKDSQPVAPFDVTRFITLEKMAASKQPMIIPDTEAESDWVKTATTRNVLSWAGAPILDGEKVIGFLSLNNLTRNYYHPEQAETLSAFASQAAIALVHARLHKEIQEMAITDPLTNIFNRRGLERWGQYEIDRAKRFSSPLSAIYFDLDHFKEVNDSYGHDAGDSVLQQVVRCSQRVIRKIDIFSRIGGEEFLIILPETTLPIAVQIAERLRETIASCDFAVDDSQLNLTISLGVVQLTEQISDLSDVINAADKYMYKSKQTGRNRSSFPTS